MATKSFIPLVMLTFASSLLLSADVDASQYRPFCGSHLDACEYTGPDAPVLRADVCWDGNQAILEVGDCPTGSWPYHVDYGEVLDPLTNEVQAYVPLDWACDVPDICVAGPPPQEASSVPICCYGSTCYEPTDDGCPAGSTAVMCKSGVSNLDGTVTCFEGSDLP